MHRLILVGSDDAREPVDEEAVRALFGGVERLEAIPQNVTIIAGQRGSEPMRGLRLDLGVVVVDVMLPEQAARQIGRALDDGIVRAAAGDLPS